MSSYINSFDPNTLKTVARGLDQARNNQTLVSFGKIFEKINLLELGQGIYKDVKSAEFDKMNVAEIAACASVAFISFSLTSNLIFYGLLGKGAYEFAKHTYAVYNQAEGKKEEVSDQELSANAEKASYIFQKLGQLKDSSTVQAAVSSGKKGGTFTFGLMKQAYDRLLGKLVERISQNETMKLEGTRLKATAKLSSVLGAAYGIKKAATLLGFYALLGSSVFLAYKYYATQNSSDTKPESQVESPAK